MKKHCNLLIGLLCLFLCTRCNEAQELGAGFFPDESFDLAVIDTLSFAVSSVLYDSIPTRNTGRLLAGYHHDAQLGRVKAAAFFQLGFAENTSYSLDENHVFYDSITLLLKYDGYSFYDTNQIQTLHVHEILEAVELPEDDTSFYNATQFLIDPNPLGSRTFTARPRRQGNLEIRLSDRLGTALFEQAIHEGQALTSSSDFQDYLKGLAIVPDTSKSAAILGFAPSAELRLYYRDDAQLPVKSRILVFPMGNNLYFNQIQSDRRGTLIKDLETFEMPVSSTSSGNEAFIQSGIGIATRIEIPYVKNIIAIDNDIIISRAVLEFSPTTTQIKTNTPLPTQLTAYWVDEDNIPIDNSFTATLQTDIEFGRDTYYSVDITNFIKTQIATDRNNKNALLLTPASDFVNAVTRLAIGDGRHRNKMQLKIYIISI